LVGTFSYLAPEQLEGKPHSTASDIYSFGMVWFEMLTGGLPFEQSPSPALAALERMQKQAPPPSSRNPAVPSDLDAIVAGCLRRSPKHRYKTTAEVLEALDELEQRSRPLLIRRKRWLVGASAFSLTLAGLGMMQGKSRLLQQHRSGATAASVSTVAVPLAAAPTDSSSLPLASDPAPSLPRSNRHRTQPPAQKTPASPAAVAASARQVPPGKTRAAPIWENPFGPSAEPEPSREVVLNAELRTGNAAH
jgi:serine/threonine-protein kinase